jgi:hypothetical protein
VRERIIDYLFERGRMYVTDFFRGREGWGMHVWDIEKNNARL